VLGIEPAANLAAQASADGLETWTEYFGTPVARRIVAERGRAKVVIANNALAQIDDLIDVATAVETLLDDDGVFVAEVPYLAHLLERVEYDTIYHEHLSYFAVAPLEKLFAGVGLQLFDVRHLPTHGGSIRIYVGRPGAHPPTADLAAARAAERDAHLGDPAAYAGFAERVSASRDALRKLLADLVRSGHRVAGLGATAKSCTLLHYCGIGTETIDFIGDSTPLKQGLLTPGTHIPVRAESSILDGRSDRVLLLAWNYADAIMGRHSDFIARGGRFIHPIPLARLVP
jgi:novobiocin biosynthesis protein NovU/D-mycarose 3-C-methyltransferase